MTKHKIHNVRLSLFFFLTIFLFPQVIPSTLHAAVNKIYWANLDTGKIQRADADGSNIEDLIDAPLPAAIAIESSGNKMYWTEDTPTIIKRANLDGTNVETLVNNDYTYIQALALDLTHGKIYWTDYGLAEIRRADLNGTNQETLVSTGLLHPLGIALDSANNTMYWADIGTNKIQRANLDGSNVEDLVIGLDSVAFLALNVTGNTIYWTDLVGKKIQRADLDGSAVQDVIASGLSNPLAIALDITSGKLYWTNYTNNGSIKRANQDGSSQEELVTSNPNGHYLGIALDSSAGTDTVTAVTSDTPDPTSVGESFTVGVSVTGTGTPTGTVTIGDGDGNSCIAGLAGGTGSCSLNATQAGTKILTAVYYSDDTSRNSSRGTAAHEVGKADSTTIILSDDPDPSVSGQPYMIMARAESSSGVPTGTIVVDNGIDNCTIPTAQGGGCTLTATGGMGTILLTACYSGDNNFYPSCSPFEDHRITAPSTTTITGHLPEPSEIGQPYTISATITSSCGTPSGRVDIDDGDGNSCLFYLLNGSGSCDLTSSSFGIKNITAAYRGDNNCGPSSATTSHMVNRVATTITITGNTPDPSLAGQPYTISAAVSSNGTPDGNVTVDDGEGNSCTITLTGGTGSCDLATSTAGAKNMTAAYNGTAVFATSSTTAGHTVNKTTAIITFTGDTPDPSVAGQPYTVNVTLTSPYVVPTGTVMIDDGETHSCTISLTAGTGSCILSSNTAGTKQLTAFFSGDANFNNSKNTELHTVIVSAIEISGKGQPVINGSTTPYPNNGTDFGCISLTDTPKTQTFTIRNSGLNDLILNGSPPVTLQEGRHFRVKVQPASPITNETTTAFQIIFLPLHSGTVKDTVRINTNDPDNNPFTFTITGKSTKILLYLPAFNIAH